MKISLHQSSLAVFEMNCIIIYFTVIINIKQQTIGYSLGQFVANGNQKAITELRKYPVLDSDSNVILFIYNIHN